MLPGVAWGSGPGECLPPGEIISVFARYSAPVAGPKGWFDWDRYEGTPSAPGQAVVFSCVFDEY
jgi:hypothetical protein